MTESRKWQQAELESMNSGLLTIITGCVFFFLSRAFDQSVANLVVQYGNFYFRYSLFGNLFIIAGLVRLLRGRAMEDTVGMVDMAAMTVFAKNRGIPNSSNEKGSMGKSSNKGSNKGSNRGSSGNRGNKGNRGILLQTVLVAGIVVFSLHALVSVFDAYGILPKTVFLDIVSSVFLLMLFLTLGGQYKSCRISAAPLTLVLLLYAILRLSSIMLQLGQAGASLESFHFIRALVMVQSRGIRFLHIIAGLLYIYAFWLIRHLEMKKRPLLSVLPGRWFKFLRK